MVRFEKDRFIVEINDENNSVEAWKETFSEMLEILEFDGFNDNYTRYRYIQLLRAMLPGDEFIEKIKEIIFDKNLMFDLKIARQKEKIDQLTGDLSKKMNPDE